MSSKTRAAAADPRRISIGLVLNTYSVVLAVLPVLIVVAIASSLFGRQARDQAVNQMNALAAAKTQEIRRWLENSEITLALVLTNPEQYQRMNDVLLSGGRTGPVGTNLTNFLKGQLALQTSFEELFIYNTGGEIRVSTAAAQVGVNIAAAAQPYFTPSLSAPYVQPPYYDAARGALTAIVTHPIYLPSGDVVGVLAGRLNLSALSAIMGTSVGLGDTAETYLVSRENTNLVTPVRFDMYDPTRSYHSLGIETALAGRDGVGFYPNYRGALVIGVYRWIPELQSGMLAEIEEAEALRAVSDVQNFSAVLALGAALVAGGIGLWIARWITRPVEKLTQVAQAVMNGDYSQQARLTLRNEIGQLGAAFDTMTGNLVQVINERNERIIEVEQLSATLEQLVLARTRRLEMIALLSEQLNAILNFDQLLNELVNQTKAQFDYYHVQIFILDTKQQTLVMQAGYGEAGAALKARGYAIPLHAQTSLVARAARNQDVVRVDNVRIEADWLANALLPDTYSEVAVPIIANDQVMGVLDVQEDEIGKLDASDASLLRSLANQVAVALSNARLFGQVTRANAEISALNERLKQENLRMEAELNVTRQLQQMLLPGEDELRHLEGLDVAGFMQPAEQVGGDYYDVLQHGNQIKIGIGDVTGHGLESGVVMLMTQTAIRTLLTSGETDPVRFLDALNRTLHANMQRMGVNKGITLTLLDYDLGRLHLKASGQHEQMIVVRRGGRTELLDTFDLGFPLGLEVDIARFVKEAAIDLNPGDGIVLYSDGITEAQSETGTFYGLGRLCDVVSRNWERPAQAIKEAVIANVRDFIGAQIVYDDLALLVVKQK